VQYPNLIGAAFFDQKRERTGGLVDVQLRPTDQLSLDFQYFMSDLGATNYNRNYLFWGPMCSRAARGRFPILAT
jgi:iron complex outermembrane receptor protein